MWPPPPPPSSCTRLTPRCSGDDLRCGCQVPHSGRGQEDGGDDVVGLLAGEDAVEDGGGKRVQWCGLEAEASLPRLDAVM